MTGTQLLTIALAGLVTFVIRASFLSRADRMVELPLTVRTVLRMIPPAALAALVLPALLRPGGGVFDPLSPVAVGGAVAALVAWWRRDLLSPLVVGLVVVVAVTPVLG